MKLPIHLWPETATALGCLAFLNGALKYGRSNWRVAGIRASIYVDAARRHLAAWFEGEECDPDDGVPHLAAALACLAIIVDAIAAGKLIDDRQIFGGYRNFVANLTPHVARLKALHAGCNPKHYTISERCTPRRSTTHRAEFSEQPKKIRSCLLMGSLKNKVGDRVGSLVIVKKLESIRYRSREGRISCKARWLVRCDCGREYPMAGTFMRKRGPKACKACAYIARPQSARRMSDSERLFRLAIKNNSRGIEVSITSDDFMQIATKPCVYCGAEPKARNFLSKLNKHAAPRIALAAHGIDRVDSTLGYVHGNCVSCCKICNNMKSTMPVAEFLEHVKKIVQHSCGQKP